MNLFSHLVSVAVAAALACGLSACGDNAANTGRNEAASAGAPSNVASSNEDVSDSAGDVGIGDKLNVYVTCYNRLNSSANKSINRYAQWVKDMDIGPTGKEKVVYGLYDIQADEVEECQQQIEQVAAAKPTLPKLDAAGKAFITSLVALTKVVNEAHPYYERENYKDDGFAKGRELHPELVKRAQAFRDASDVFSDELEAENDKALAAQLVEIEKAEGRKAAYWKMSLMMQAKQLVNVVAEEEFSVETATAKAAAFEKVADEMNAYAKANKDALPSGWWTLESAAEDFRQKAKTRLRRIRDKEPYNHGEQMLLSGGSGAWMVDGSEAQVIDSYNKLIDSSNRLN